MEPVTQGETIQVKLTALTPEGRYVRDGHAVARVSGPDGADATLAAGIEPPWVEAQRGYVFSLDTADMPPGVYQVTAEVTGLTPAGPARGFSPPQEFTVVPRDS